MGCDIHVFYETQQDDGSWAFHDHTAPYKTGVKDEDGDQIDYSKLWSDPLEIGRHYRFFAFLAGVRNGSGFAGCDTGDEVVPIDEPRGVPEDASAEYQSQVAGWNGDGHSHSFFTAAEIRDADWDQTTVERGLLGFSEYPKFKEQGNLDGLSYCGDAWGRDIVKLTNEEADDLVTHPEKQEAGKTYYVRVQYARPLREELEYALSDWLPAVMKLHEDPKKVRVCFFFDN